MQVRRKAIMAAVAAAMLVSPVAASAQTLTLDQLLAQALANLNAILNGPNIPLTPETPVSP